MTVVAENRVETIAAQPAVRAALSHLAATVEAAVDLAVAIQQIPAPTFAEAERAAWVAGRFQALGLADVSQDEIGNVYGRYAGSAVGRPVVVSAHLDTVFPQETDLSVRRDGVCVYGPGIADNSIGVAGLLLLAETLSRFDLRPPADIWLLANVGEEGLGDLRGMKAAVDHFGPEAIYLVVEGGSFGRLFHRGIGVRRFRLDVTAPGGHSWGNFGNASAIHVLGQLIAAIAALPVPAEPKTTYNVGLIEGGTSINSIAHRASLWLDLRSEEPAALAQLIGQVEELVAQANQQPGVSVAMTLIGNRPVGQINRDAPLMQWAEAALRQVGCGQIEWAAGSTDANVPLGRGYDAVCIGLAKSSNSHRPDEYLDTTYLAAGLGQLLLLSLAAAGYEQ
jgi:acetylornithine deacetylase/succinyl-diaminopimelate desuccinylase-like protein